MYDIVGERHILPECLRVSGISWTSKHGDQPVSTRGGFADIFIGLLDNQQVALKRMRGIPSAERLVSMKIWLLNLLIYLLSQAVT